MKYKVGDKVRVRQWDDMMEEFGKCLNGINTPDCLFVSGMKKYCGEFVTIKGIRNDKMYSIVEDDESWYWTDNMFEQYKTEETIDYNEFINRLAKDFAKEPVIFMPKHDTTIELIGKITEETKGMMKNNLEMKKETHPKDEDHLVRVANIQKKIDFYKNKSGFDKIEEVVPGKVLRIELAPEGMYAPYKCKTVCDDRDIFSIENGLYLALAKRNFSNRYTPEGIEKKMEEMKLEKRYVERVAAAMKMIAAQEELIEENAEYELLLEARKKSRWERKQRQMDRRAERKKLQEQKEREEKIQIQAEAIIRAKEIAKQEKKNK